MSRFYGLPSAEVQMAIEAKLGSNLAWVKAHEALSRIARDRAGLDHEEAHWLRVAFRTGAHVQL